ncbi:MAG: DUF1549 domain-containing protein [Planctomycetes bacterium]|nr:DUF1549 domain-containing protein [Planctomycetota bacterium]
MVRNLVSWCLWPAGSLAWLVLWMASTASAAPPAFRDAVAPIFERHCVGCHQGEKPKGGLSLTDAATFGKGGENGPAVVPGKPADSLLIELVSGDKPAMPQRAKPLTAAEVDILRQWIASGAEWPQDLILRDKRRAGDDAWWSFQPLQRPVVPQIQSSWVQTPIDAFILARLQEKQLTPSAAADRRTLIRRLTFDLHGLPPTPEDIAAFLADTAPDAYERLVDRLLESPRYGERWGRHWLDVVHFGESHGYDKDKPRPNAWPYRDYVINALNADKPYDRFIREQLAGDVLFPDDPQALVATGFIAAGPWDFVGHVELREGTLDKKIARSNDRDDMVATAMLTFQSLTVTCARCHNHKFDPISQEEYYRLQAVFAGVDRADQAFDPDPAVHLARRRWQSEKSKFATRHQELTAIVAGITTPEIERLDAELKDLKSQVASLPQPGGAGDSSPTNGYHSGIEANADVEKWVQVDLGESRPIGEILLVPARPVDFPDTPGFGFPARFRIDVSDDPQFTSRKTLVDHTARDFANPGDQPFVVAPADCRARFIRVTATRLWKRTNDYVFALSELQAVTEKSNLAFAAPVTALDTIEAGRWSTKHLVDGYSSRTRLADAATLKLAATRKQKLDAQIAERAARRQAAVEERLAPETRAELKATTSRLAEIDAELAKLPPAKQVYSGASRFAAMGSFTAAAAPRPVYFLHRGNDKTPGEEMAPGALSCFPGLSGAFELSNPADEGARRAALANWITNPRNPLTARSIANRVWQYHFGRGIVDTPNDFGHQGALPTHRELLDWLAAELISPTPDLLPGNETPVPWTLKRLHRLILRSAVYRQSSADNPQNAAIDAGNQFLWRMNRQRLEAEALRDTVLFVAGKLDLTVGGPSVQQFFFKDDHSPIYDYERFDVDSPAGQRRSVYRFIVRSVPDPFMECLDCADPSLLTPKRNTTLTALQALSLLNNQFMVRESEHFAHRLEAAAKGLPDQIALGYRLAFGRDPSSAEQTSLRDYASKNGLVNLCRVLFNSNEFLFID